MLEIILKKLEVIKEHKLKKEFLKKEIGKTKDKKFKEKLKKLIEELNKIEKKEQEDKKEPIIEPNFTTPKSLEIEEAPKYEESPTEVIRERRQGLSRLEQIASLAPSQGTNQREYGTPREETPTPNLYRTPEDIRREIEDIRINREQTSQYIRDIRPPELLSYDLQKKTEEELRRSLENPKFELNTAERADQNYSPNIVENFKKQKKHLQDKYVK